ncbi:MAG: hypothetical protein JOY54_07810 [Acidobacteriaceae bacterium]|nr:hypothetical protein [Acidobacteriaceae bacterium]
MVLRLVSLALATLTLLAAQSSSPGPEPDQSAPASSADATQAPPPLTCPAGAPLGPVDLRVRSPQGGEPLPFQSIIHLSEGDTLLYTPVLRSHEKRPGEVAIVMVPEKHEPNQAGIIVTEPKAADKPQQWEIPQTISLAALVYSAQGLNKKKVEGFLSQDDLLIAQLADYAAKTAQTEALIEALENSGSSAASVNAALSGFASQYGVSVQIDKTAPTAVQAQTLFSAMNPQLATYNPLASSASERVGQTASVATAVATLFFGSPIGLAAGGTAMLLDLRSIAFPGTQFRSSFTQPIPNKTALNLCGQRGPAPPHTRVAYIWAVRIPNTRVPSVQIGKANFIPPDQKTPVPVDVPDAEWKYLERARQWTLLSDKGQKTPIKVLKLGNQKAIEMDLGKSVAPGDYKLTGYWDWTSFEAKGLIHVRPLSTFQGAKLRSSSQDTLLAKCGKVAVTLTGSDFEFTSKVELKKLGDEFATAEPARFILPAGLREGPQDYMDVQIDTTNLDPGKYALLVSQQDNKSHPIEFKVLPNPPRIDNFPILANTGVAQQHYVLKGERLSLLSKLSAPGVSLDLGASNSAGTERNVTVQLKSDLKAGATLPVEEYLSDRTEPLKLDDAVQITGPLPVIASSKLSVPAAMEITLHPDEFPAGYTLTAMLDVKNIEPKSVLQLQCSDESASVTLHNGEQTKSSSLQQLSQDQMFLSYDTSELPAGCSLQAVISNGRDGRSEPYTLAHVVRIPFIDSFAAAGKAPDGSANVYMVTGRNLEMIQKAGWDQTEGVDSTELPVPVPGQGQEQSLSIKLPDPPAPRAMLFVWLRGDSAGRPTNIPAPSPGKATPNSQIPGTAVNSPGSGSSTAADAVQGKPLIIIVPRTTAVTPLANVN